VEEATDLSCHCGMNELGEEGMKGRMNEQINEGRNVNMYVRALAR